jgi:tetratricopeptide (TPR) repeat protein
MAGMKREGTIRHSVWCVCAAAVFAAGCATAMPTPADLPRLEASRERAPDDVNVLTALGVAYREDGQLDAARAALEGAIAIDPEHASAHFYLGLIAEDQEDYERAATVYESFLTSSRSSGLRDDMEDRLARVRRLELLREVETSVIEESQISALPPTPGTVGVFPFRFAASNEAYRPLATAMAELLTVDLNQVDRITVLERFRVRALLEEIALTDAGLVDPSTASRGGRLLRAEHVVQGDIGGIGDDLSYTALLVEAATGLAEDQVESSNLAQRFIDMEKDIVFGLFQRLGIALTVAERERIEQNRTENLQALLAFGVGWEASDAGDFEEAQRQFGLAVSLDAGFIAAGQAAGDVGQLNRGFGTSTAEAGALGMQEVADGLEYSRWVERRYGFDGIEALTPQNPVRDPVSEVLGEEVLSPALLRIVFPRPGGEQ